MGLVFDTNVFIQIEKGARTPDFSAYGAYGEVFISAVTVSELLVGVHRTDSEGRRAKRAAFVESILARVGSLSFTGEVARVHAQLFASLAQKGQMIGAHDLIIAATALYHDFPILTGNTAEFKRVEGLNVLSL